MKAISILVLLVSAAFVARSRDQWQESTEGMISRNGPITYELDGIQYLVVAAGDAVCAFAMLAR